MGKASERRTERVKSLLISTLSELIREELADPRIGIFSITDANLARDLSTAEILVAVVGGGEATDASVKVLNSAAPLLWNRLREETDLRTVPRLRFSADHRGQYIDEIYTLLEQVRPTLGGDEKDSAEDDAGNVSSFADAAEPDAAPDGAQGNRD